MVNGLSVPTTIMAIKSAARKMKKAKYLLNRTDGAPWQALARKKDLCKKALDSVKERLDC